MSENLALVRVTAPHFCAAMEMNEFGVCVRAPPILKWAVGKHRNYLASYFRQKGWEAAFVSGAEKADA
jgi:hypothetical protein